MDKLLFNVLLAAAIAAIAVSFWRFHKNGERYKNFNLLDLICTSDGRPSRTAVQEGIVFLLMCWGFVIFVNKGALPEWYVTVFVGAFVLRSAYSMWMQSKNPPGQGKKGGEEKNVPAATP